MEVQIGTVDGISGDYKQFDDDGGGDDDDDDDGGGCDDDDDDDDNFYILQISLFFESMRRSRNTANSSTSS